MSQEWRLLKRLVSTLSAFSQQGSYSRKRLNFQFNYIFIFKQKSTELHSHLQFTLQHNFLNCRVYYIVPFNYLPLSHISSYYSTFMQKNSSGQYFVHYPLLLLLLLSHFSHVRLSATPQTAAHQAPPSLGFSRQEHWSGLPFPSPMHESEK